MAAWSRTRRTPSFPRVCSELLVSYAARACPDGRRNGYPTLGSPADSSSRSHGELQDAQEDVCFPLLSLLSGQLT
ncbi:Uncharacterised protein [Mycobacteroides abscessus subsp. abscessus]|nr:Uncharacterised protein [Mycobacteroides abscessus subsp. abscessus]